MAFTLIWSDQWLFFLLSSANSEQGFIEGIPKLVLKQIVGGGGKYMWKQVWKKHGVHFRPRDQQVPKHGEEHVGALG